MYAAADSDWRWKGGLSEKPITRDVRQHLPTGPAPELNPAPLQTTWTGSGYWGAAVPDLRGRLPTITEGAEDSGSTYCMLDNAIALNVEAGSSATRCIQRNGSFGYTLRHENQCVHAPSCRNVSWYKI